MTKKTFCALLPDGSTKKRTTSRIFTHVIAVIEDPTIRACTTPSWGITTWCGRFDLAESEANKARNKPYWADVRIIECTVERDPQGMTEVV